MNSETTISFENENGFRISKSDLDLTTGKVIVNGIEITSVEDWKKVTQSIVELQQENQQLKDKINKAYTQFYDMFYHQLGYKYDFDENDLLEIHKLENLLKGDKE